MWFVTGFPSQVNFEGTCCWFGDEGGGKRVTGHIKMGEPPKELISFGFSRVKEIHTPTF